MLITLWWQLQKFKRGEMSGDIKRMETEGVCAKLRKMGVEDATLGQIEGYFSEFFAIESFVAILSNTTLQKLVLMVPLCCY